MLSLSPHFFSVLAMADLMVDEVVLKNEEEISEWSDGLPVLLICAFLVVFDSGDVKDDDIDVIVQ